MNPGDRCIHKTLGPGVLEPTNKRIHPQQDPSYVYFRPDKAPEGWSPIVLVDIEALRKE